MEEEKTLDLTNLYGFARLYKTLVQDGGRKRSTGDMLYGCYLANISACNKSGMDLQPVEPEIFFYKLETSHVEPYKTNIQTIKALTLLEWNTDTDAPHTQANQAISEMRKTYTHHFYDATYHSYRDSVTSFSLCEDTLDPIYEPESELNPGALLRKHETGPKLVYISAPLRGDIENNIAFAKEKAREVFLEGNIPVCPHLLFPPIADPRNPVEDKAAMGMCLKLLERCSEIRAYGPVWSEGMWQEIKYAEKLKIPILTDQTEVPRTRRRREPCR